MRFGSRSPNETNLQRYWDALVTGASTDEVARLGALLDPSLVTLIARVRATRQQQLPDPAFVNVLEGRVMTTFARTHSSPIPLHPDPRQPRTSRVPARTTRGRLIDIPAPRRKWALAQLATAILLIFTLAAIYFAFLHDNQRVHQPATPLPTPIPSTPSGDWSMYLGDAARSNIADAGPVKQPGPLWRFQVGGPCSPTPAIVGTVVYAACGDGILYALDAASGVELWRFTSSEPWAYLAATTDLVYAVDSAGTLHAIDIVTAIERWRSDLSISADLVVSGGLLAVGTTDGFLIGLDSATGQEWWRLQVDTDGGVRVPAMADNLIYVSSDTGGFVAVDAATGVVRWRADTGDESIGAPRVIDGVVYLGISNSGTARLRAFDAVTGKVLWTNDLPIGGLTVVGDVGIAGGSDGNLYAVDIATGNVRWQVPIDGMARGVIAAGDVAYVFIEGDRTLYARDVATGEERWHYDLGESVDRGFSVAHGVIYFGTGAGSIYALGETGTPTPGDTSTTAASPTTAPASPSTPASSPVADMTRNSRDSVANVVTDDLAAIERSNFSDFASGTITHIPLLSPRGVNTAP